MSKVAGLTMLMAQIIAEQDYPADHMGTYLQPMVQGRGCHCEFTFFPQNGAATETARIEKLILDASQRLMQAGAFFSRPYGPWADMVYDACPEGVAALKQLKDIFDPNHILNPGKLCL
jgi:FAD/FMN-containing dehydrogenase